MDTIVHNSSLKVKGFMESVRAAETGPGTICVFWLGQAGFIVKTPLGKLIAIDPYLSDYCEHAVGFKRIMLSVIPPEELEADFLFVSHEHGDHFDADLFRILSAKEAIRILGPESCRKPVGEAGIPPERFTLLVENQTMDFGEFKVIPVKADHGDLSPDALGFIFDFGFTRVYFAGDTAYSPDKLRKVFEVRPEIALLPINGEYGNLDPAEAIKLAGEIGAKVLIPCHYWTFIEHGSYPLGLKREAERPDTAVKPVFLAQGEGYLYRTV